MVQYGSGHVFGRLVGLAHCKGSAAVGACVKVHAEGLPWRLKLIQQRITLRLPLHLHAPRAAAAPALALGSACSTSCSLCSPLSLPHMCLVLRAPPCAHPCRCCTPQVLYLFAAFLEAPAWDFPLKQNGVQPTRYCRGDGLGGLGSSGNWAAHLPGAAIFSRSSAEPRGASLP